MISNLISRAAPFLCIFGLGTFIRSAHPADASELAAPGLPPVMPLQPEDDQPVDLSSPFEWKKIGPFTLTPSLSSSLYYDDNITIRSETKRDDLIWLLSPTLAAIAGETQEGTGRHLTLEYTPSLLVFTSHDEFTTVDHDASVAGVWPFSRLRLGASQGYSRISSTLIDIGDRVIQTVYDTRLTSEYDLTDRTSFEINARQLIRDYDNNGLSSREWVNDNWFNYGYFARLETSVGLTFGYVDADQNPSQNYQQLLLRGVYDLTGKIDLTGSAGVEWRHYGGGGGDELSPVFSLGASWTPWDGTTVTLEGHRRNQTSAFLAGQNYLNTGVGLSLRHRLGHRLAAAIVTSYENVDYQSARAGVNATREDSYFSIRPSLDLLLGLRWTAGLFYQYRQNDSEGQGAVDFTNNQVGILTAYSF